MSDGKRDLLQVCMKGLGPNPPTLPEFKAVFCDRCLQKECTRSQAGTSLFEQRVNTWEERLFKNPKKLPQDDPRFAQITAQRFVDIASRQGTSIPIIGQSPPQTSSWVDPRDLEQAPPPPAPSPPMRERSQEPAPEKTTPFQKSAPPEKTDSEPTKVTKPSEEQPLVPPKPKAPPPGPLNAPANTPFTQGTMIGSPKQSVSPSKDAWSAPTPDPVGEGVRVLKPGEKFRFGK